MTLKKKTSLASSSNHSIRIVSANIFATKNETQKINREKL